jgi:hypothetical protein
MNMRSYQANRALGHAAAGDQRDILLHASRAEAEMTTLHARLEYLRRKSALPDARDRGDGRARRRRSFG